MSSSPGKVFKQTVCNSMITNCAPFVSDIFLYSYEAEFIVFALGWKETASQFNFTYRHIDDVLSINNPDFQNYLGQMYPAELEIKDTTESNTSASDLNLLLSIGKNGQLRTLFMTNVMISTSISQTFFSWVAIFHLRQPMVCLSHSLYGVTWLALLMSVLFLERCDFYVSFSGRNMSGNVWNRPSGISMVDMGIS